MPKIQFVKGDATLPEGEGNKIIAHICNDLGYWGAGFVLALSERWKEPEKQYRKWFREKGLLPLGEVQFVKAEEKLWIANLVAQHDILPHNNISPIRYEALQKALKKVAVFAQEKKASVHMPKIGFGLAGGDWKKIEGIIKKELAGKGVSVTVYMKS